MSYGHHQEMCTLIFYVWQCFLSERMWVDYGTGDHCHILNLNSINMDDEKKFALLGFHATTGNDYVFFLSFGKRKVVEDS